MKRILIIEDEIILRNLLEKKFKQEGYEVTVAVDGEDGIEKMRENKPDLIVLDIIMPRLDGFGVMEKMKEDDNLKDIYIMIVSNSGQPVELDRARRLGARDWLIKTDFDPQEVISKVSKILCQQK
jgi:two-component system, chemotaxis family, chemotaxis protein CheY